MTRSKALRGVSDRLKVCELVGLFLGGRAIAYGRVWWVDGACEKTDVLEIRTRSGVLLGRKHILHSRQLSFGALLVAIF